MNEKRQKRLSELQNCTPTQTPFTYADLLLLLKEDKPLRKLIRAITNGGKTNTQEDIPLPPEISVAVAEISEQDTSPAEIISKPVESATSELDPLRNTLASELELLARVRVDTEIAADWLSEASENENRQLVQLIARAAQWDSILDLWERFSARCKARQSAALPEELAILDACLKIHNLIWRSRQADFTHAAIGASYDYRQHQRGTLTGETVAAEWLPGLTNASGTTQKPPLVATR